VLAARAFHRQPASPIVHDLLLRLHCGIAPGQRARRAIWSQIRATRSPPQARHAIASFSALFTIASQIAAAGFAFIVSPVVAVSFFMAGSLT
jgi:hypothetical protein